MEYTYNKPSYPSVEIVPPGFSYPTYYNYASLMTQFSGSDPQNLTSSLSGNMPLCPSGHECQSSNANRTFTYYDPASGVSYNCDNTRSTGNELGGLENIDDSTLSDQRVTRGNREKRRGRRSASSNKKKPKSTNTNNFPLFGCGSENYDEQDKKRPDPFAAEAIVPLPYQMGDDYGYFGPAAVWKRNERERLRVRSVNDGYERLRRALPLTGRFKDKRISKVETLRLACRYIEHLKLLLSDPGHDDVCECALYPRTTDDSIEGQGCIVIGTEEGSPDVADLDIPFGARGCDSV